MKNRTFRPKLSEDFNYIQVEYFGYWFTNIQDLEQFMLKSLSNKRQDIAETTQRRNAAAPRRVDQSRHNSPCQGYQHPFRPARTRQRPAQFRDQAAFRY